MCWRYKFVLIQSVTFSTVDSYRKAKEKTGVHLLGLWCKVVGGGPPITIIHVFDYPFDDDEDIEAAMADYGVVKQVKKHTYLSNTSVYTGT